jgi:hypothetical protein
MTRHEEEERGEAEDLVEDVLAALGFNPMPGGHERAIDAVGQRLTRLRHKWKARVMQPHARDYDDE